ncbi:PTS IIA-like nitrogen-regulatory protein PtsN [Stagnimonas aquatica]|uniref:PTS IIA-like nitrogen-regulatory protein PtsN n=1 Tax=Stagnimonas aquatica TaxID=2689987 RepID=A0A3N0VL09_9GAMM|nr:PTS IIA-like nitrogen regulatory protein PtsN [Stagnimonas aquatica]ROH93449.1 PTS IIA-like nitrogen-regulatory protein PtsN [Stagnimonas aquatica]
MKLAEILSASRVVAGVTVTSKKRALEEMSKLLAKGAGTVTDAEIFTSLTSREKLGSTGLGHGVAIPHGRMSGVENSIGALIRLKHPVDYDAHDGQTVDLLFGLVVPQQATETHLKHLAAIAELFSDEAFCKQARAAADDAALYALVTSRS